MLAAITAFLIDLPLLGSMLKTITSWFVPTPAQEQQTNTQNEQTEETKINNTGRPSQ